MSGIGSEKEFLRTLESNYSKLTDSYKTLLCQSMITETEDHQRQMIKVAVANIVYACQSLLDQIQQLRTYTLLSQSRSSGIVKEDVNSTRCDTEIMDISR